MVLRWNDAATFVVTNAPPGPPIPPFIESRYYAMVNLAMHDTLNIIVPKYKTYGLKSTDYKGVNPDAAVAQAAHDVIVYFFDKLNPPANFSSDAVKNHIEQLLETSLNDVESSEDKTRAIELGKNAAMAIIQKRMNDGWNQVMFPVQQGDAAGGYRFTFPFTITLFELPPPFTGFYDSPGWGEVTPFGLTSSTQFDVPDPRENSLSRIYVGYHFRKACMYGEALGKNIGGWIASHALGAE